MKRYILPLILILCLISPLIGYCATPTGGTITYDGDYTIHTFTENGTFTIPAGMSGNVEVLVVAGGGGGEWDSGGGGAGGYLYEVSHAVTAQDYSITVGAGGAGGHGSTNGFNSVFDTITAIGGGRGNKDFPGSAGGSGAGGAGGGAGGDGTLGQGNDGGNAFYAGYCYGGGGGAGATGGSASQYVSGNGGSGTACSISGSSVTRAGGGGGGASVYTPGDGGGGGGGDGATGSDDATAGTVNTGGGGGGADDGNGGAGGSGIVIIRYLTADFDATAPTVTTNAATNAEATSATLNGNVTSDGDSTITERGFYCDTNESPTTKYVVAGTTGEYTKDMTDLIPGTKYYFKAFATNSEGTSYGSILNFTTAVGVTYYAQRSTNVNDDSAWQAETEIGRDSSGFGHMSLVPMDSEKVMALFNDYDGSNYNLKYRIYDSSWGASTTAATDCKDNTAEADWDEYHWFSAVADSSNNVHVIYVDSDDNDLNYIYYNGSTWSSAQEIYTGTVTHPSLSYDSTSGNLVAFLIEGNAIKYKVKKSDSWGDPSGGAVVKTGLDSPTSLGSAYSDATSIGIIWRETSSSPYAISYAILTLSEARSDIIRIKGGVRLKGGLRLK